MTWQGILANAAPTIAAIGAALVAWRNLKKTEEVHVSINSRMDELLKITRLQGIADGRQQQKDNPNDH